MKYGQIPGIPFPVSRIVQGSTIIRRDEHFELLDQLFEMGINAIDTARVYGNEALVGKWINSRGVRDQICLIAKGAHHKPGQDGQPDEQRCDPQHITEDLYRSLENFETDYIDLCVMHRDNPDYPVGEIVDCLSAHQDAGRIRGYGGSNWSHERLAAGLAHAEAHGRHPFCCSSPNFSLAEQYDPPWANCVSISGPRGEAARAWYRERDFPLLTWSSMAGGFWSGRYTKEDCDRLGAENPNNHLYRCYSGDSNWQRLARVRELAAERGLSVAQIATSFLFHQGLNIFALIANNSADELRENIAAIDFQMTHAEMQWLDLRRDDRD